MRRKPMVQTSPFGPILQEWQTAANAGNTNAIQKLYATTTEAIALFTEGPIIKGAAEIAADLGAHFGPNNPYQKISITEDDYKQQGNWAWSYGTWSATLVTPQGQEPINGSWSVFWVQQGSTWLIQLHSVVPYIKDS
jgi:ketosteroid isomerase-like protein